MTIFITESEYRQMEIKIGEYLSDASTGEINFSASDIVNECLVILGIEVSTQKE